MPLLYKDLNMNFKQFVFGKQVHGRNIEIVTCEKKQRLYPYCDGFITSEKGIVINVITADCLPIFIYDPIKSVIALLHSGWVGTYLRIVEKGIKLIEKTFGCSSKNILVHIGPSISANNYKVSNNFIDYFPNSIIKKKNQTFLDLQKENIKLLISCGLSEKNITSSNSCTYSNVEECHSFRRDGGKSQRMVSFMMIS